MTLSGGGAPTQAPTGYPTVVSRARRSRPRLNGPDDTDAPVRGIAITSPLSHVSPLPF